MSKRLSAEARRTSIIQHSKPLLAKHGLSGVSVNDLAKACHVNAAVLYQHFPSKEILYRTVLEEFACTRDDYVDAVLTGPDDFGNVLYRMTLVYAKSRSADVDILRIELRSIIEGDAIRDEIFTNQWKGFTDYIEATLEEMIETKQIPAIDLTVASMTYV
ncbi:MAG TPA: TetR/AcrR family transcriptional regulator, partial [Magnetovibrio sp.]